MCVAWKTLQAGAEGGGQFQADFHCHYPATQVFPQFLQSLAFGIQMNSPHLTLIFQIVKKSKHTSHYSPGTVETHVNGGGRQTKKTRGGKRVEGEKEKGGEGIGARKEKVHNELTLGMLSLVQTPSDNNLSRISQAKMDGHSRLYWAILLTTSGVATLGLLPPIALGLMEPVS